MPAAPAFHYFLGAPTLSVSPGAPIWSAPLPATRHHFSVGGQKAPPPLEITHGEYFELVHRFLCRDEGARLRQIAGEIHDIEVRLMKHGRFYHPARVDVIGPKTTRALVLNVALSAPGKDTIGGEIATLKALGGLPAPVYLPRVFDHGTVSVRNGLAADVFLGEWFDGYHEFHLTRAPSSDDLVLEQWQDSGDRSVLSDPAAYALYHEASRILTGYYDPATTRRIFPWHHAAGDFVVRTNGKSLTVRLITVRGFVPLISEDNVGNGLQGEAGGGLAALLIFLLDLSVRMRLDRLSGIGDTAWAEDIAVPGIWTGFIAGLSENRFTTDPAGLVNRFRNYLAAHRPEDLLALARQITDTWPNGSADRHIARRHLDAHILRLCDTIGQMGFTD